MFVNRDEIKEYISQQYGLSLKVIDIGKIYKDEISILGDLVNIEMLIGYEYEDFRNKDLGMKITRLMSIPPFFDVTVYDIKEVLGVKLRQIPLKCFPEYGKKVEDIGGQCQNDQDPLKCKSTVIKLDGDDINFNVLSARDYACIHLKIPNSSKEWLNKLIMQNQQIYDTR